MDSQEARTSLLFCSSVFVGLLDPSSYRLAARKVAGRITFFRLCVPSVQLLAFLASSIRTGKHESGDAVGHAFHVEVDEQPERYIEQLHIAQELSLVDRQDLLNRLRLHEHA